MVATVNAKLHTLAEYEAMDAPKLLTQMNYINVLLRNKQIDPQIHHDLHQFLGLCRADKQDLGDIAVYHDNITKRQPKKHELRERLAQLVAREWLMSGE